MDNILFFANFEDETDDDLTVSLNESTTVREMMLHVLREFGKECNGGLEKYVFMYGQKLISSEKYLNKTLKEIGLQNNRRLKVMRIDHLNPA